jgi:hypothetical protein
MPLYIFILALLAVGVTFFVYGYSQGQKQGIEIATDLTITHTLDSLKDAAKEIGKIDDLQAVIEKAFDIAKVKAAEKRLEYFKRITKRDYGKDV